MGWGGGVTLHGVSWVVGAVAPACIDLDRKPIAGEGLETICHRGSWTSVSMRRVFTHTFPLSCTFYCILSGFCFYPEV